MRTLCAEDLITAIETRFPQTADWWQHRAAVANLEADRPAFYVLAQAGFATAGILGEAANRLGSVPLAIDECNGVSARAGSAHDFRNVTILDVMLPLNHAAAFSLVAAYRLCGTFRDVGELLHRTERAAGTTLPATPVSEAA